MSEPVGRDFAVTIDHRHGGRWTSLVDPHGHEWLWSRPAPGREQVRPGSDFVDVGGLEECFPTVGGPPDHGDVWSRPWVSRGAGWWSVRSGGATFARRVRVHDEVVVDYRLEGPPGESFVWCAHVSLVPVQGLAVLACDDHPVDAWPGHVRPVPTTWPRVLGIEGYDTLGPDDGSAMFCVLPRLRELTVRTGDRRLTFALTCADQPVGMGLWRNLGGYPWAGPTYRNVVIEPMLGCSLTPDLSRPIGHAVVPPSGLLTWQLRILGR